MPIQEKKENEIFIRDLFEAKEKPKKNTQTIRIRNVRSSFFLALICFGMALSCVHMPLKVSAIIGIKRERKKIKS